MTLETKNDNTGLQGAATKPAPAEVVRETQAEGQIVVLKSAPQEIEPPKKAS